MMALRWLVVAGCPRCAGRWLAAHFDNSVIQMVNRPRM